MIRINPIAVPINAPNIGIKAVNPSKTPIVEAYGNLNISIPTKTKLPKIKASKH